MSSDPAGWWSEEQEAGRTTYLEAGLPPRLFNHWQGLTTHQLELALAELGTRWPHDLREHAANLKAEIDYRSGT